MRGRLTFQQEIVGTPIDRAPAAVGHCCANGLLFGGDSTAVGTLHIDQSVLGVGERLGNIVEVPTWDQKDLPARRDVWGDHVASCYCGIRRDLRGERIRRDVTLVGSPALEQTRQGVTKKCM